MALIEQKHLEIDRHVFLVFYLCCPLQLPCSKLNGCIIYSIKSIVTLELFINSAVFLLNLLFFFFIIAIT